MAKGCLNIVDNFKRGHTSKSKAIMSVSQAVAREVGDASSDAAANIRRTYFNMLDSFESELGKGREYGRATSEAARSDDNKDSIGENEFEPNFK